MSGRGSESTIECDYCGRRVPRSRSYSQYKPLIGGIRSGNRFYRPKEKYYLCMRCAKRKHVIK